MKVVIALQPLPQRMLLSGSATVEGRVLNVSGDELDNRIEVRVEGGNVIAVIDGQTSGRFALADVESVRIEGHRGNDYLANRTGLPSLIRGLDGRDTLIGGAASDRLEGGKGNDLLVPNAGPSLTAEEVNQLHGGSGTDRVDYSALEHAVDAFVLEDNRGLTISPLPANPFREPDAIDFDVELVQLTHQDDVVGFNGSILTSFDGLRGDDQFANASEYTFDFGGTVPTLFGGAGDDQFQFENAPSGLIHDGGPGDDTFVFVESAPTVRGGRGRDAMRWHPVVVPQVAASLDLRSCTGLEGVDLQPFVDQSIIVRAPDDSVLIQEITPGGGPMMLIGGAGNDTLIGGDANDSLLGGGGDDCLLGGQGQDVLRAGDGNDFVDGGPANDRLYGDAGNDTIFAHRGRDRVYGGDGDDVIFARDGRRDTLYGGPGEDSASIDDGPEVFDLVAEIEQFT